MNYNTHAKSILRRLGVTYAYHQWFHLVPTPSSHLRLLRLRASWPSRHDLSTFHKFLSKVLDRFRQPDLDGHHGLPSDLLLRGGDVWPALPRIVLRSRQELDGGIGLSELFDQLCELFHCVLIWIADVHRERVVSIHELHQSFDEIVDILERARLLAIAVDGDVLALQCLDDEVAHDAAVVGVHAGSEGVEDASYAHLCVSLGVIGVHHGLRHALAFIIASAGTDRIHMAPIALLLRMYFWVAIDFRGGGEQHASL
jgi:hypothetical protein